MVSYVGRFAPAVACSLTSVKGGEPATELTSSRSNTTNGDATGPNASVRGTTAEESPEQSLDHCSDSRPLGHLRVDGFEISGTGEWKKLDVAAHRTWRLRGRRVRTPVDVCSAAGRGHCAPATADAHAAKPPASALAPSPARRRAGARVARGRHLSPRAPACLRCLRARRRRAAAGRRAADSKWQGDCRCREHVLACTGPAPSRIADATTFDVPRSEPAGREIYTEMSSVNKVLNYVPITAVDYDYKGMRSAPLWKAQIAELKRLRAVGGPRVRLKRRLLTQDSCTRTDNTIQSPPASIVVLRL